MIDPSHLHEAEDHDEFDDSAQHDDAFQLESLESYPGELPYEVPEGTTSVPDAGAATSSAPEMSADTEEERALKQSLESELQRSQQRRSKKDTLEDSINRLKARLDQPAESPGLSRAESVVFEESAPEPSSTSNLPSLPSTDTIEDLPLDLPADAIQQPDFDESLVDEMPSTQETVFEGMTPEAAPQAADNEDSSTSPSDISNDTMEADDFQEDVPVSKRRSRVWVYAGVASIAALLIGGGSWWWMQHGGTKQDNTHLSTSTQTSSPKTTQTPAQHSETASTTKVPGAESGKSETTRSDNNAVEHPTPASEQPKPLATAQPTQHEEKSAHAEMVQKTGTTESRSEPKAIAKAHEPMTAATKPTSVDIPKKSAPSVAASKTPQSKPTTSNAASVHGTKHSPSSPSIAENTPPSKPVDLVVKPPKTLANTDDGVKHGASTKSPVADVSTAKPAAKEPKEMAKNITAKDQAPATKQGDDAAQGEEPKLIAKPVFRSTPSSTKGVYTVQVYSSPSRDDAEEWVKKLKAKNVEEANLSEQQIRGTTFYRVRFGSFSTRQEAESAAIHSGFATSWIDRIK